MLRNVTATTAFIILIISITVNELPTVLPISAKQCDKCEIFSGNFALKFCEFRRFFSRQNLRFCFAPKTLYSLEWSLEQRCTTELDPDFKNRIIRLLLRIRIRIVIFCFFRIRIRIRIQFSMITNDFKVAAISIESRYIYNFYIIPIQDSESDSVS